MLGPEQAHKKARADLSVLLHICCAPTMLFLGGLDVTLAVRPARFQRRTLRQQGREGGFSFSDVSTGIGEMETQLANLFSALSSASILRFRMKSRSLALRQLDLDKPGGLANQPATANTGRITSRSRPGPRNDSPRL